MIDIYVLDGARVMTNGALITLGDKAEAENVFLLNPGTIRIRHFTFRGRKEELIKKAQGRPRETFKKEQANESHKN